MLAPLHVPTFWKGWKRLVRCFRRKTAACWKKPLTLQWDTAKFAEKSLTECPEFWNEYMPQSLTNFLCNSSDHFLPLYVRCTFCPRQLKVLPTSIFEYHSAQLKRMILSSRNTITSTAKEGWRSLPTGNIRSWCSVLVEVTFVRSFRRKSRARIGAACSGQAFKNYGLICLRISK